MEGTHEKSPEKKRGRVLKWIAGVFVILFLLLFVAEWILEGKIRKAIGSREVEITGRIYVPQAGKVKLNLLTRSVVLQDLELREKTPGKTLPDSLGEIVGKMPGPEKTSVPASVQRIAVKGVRVGKENGKYRVRIRQVLVRSPYAFLDHVQLRPSGGPVPEGGQGDSLLRGRDAGERKSVLERIASLQIGNMEVENGNIRYAGEKDGEEISCSLDGFNFQGSKIVFPSGKWFAAEDMNLSFDRFRSLYHSGAMALEADSLRIGLRDSSFSVSSIRMLPQYGEYEYAKKVKDHADWTRITAGPVKAAGVDFDRFMAERVLCMDSLSVSEADVHSYKNRQLYQKPKIKPLFWIALHHLPFKIKIPTAILGKIDVTYEELSAEGLNPGKITITGITGRAKGLTNIPSGNGEKTCYTLDADGYLMGKGNVKAHFRLPVDSLDTHFEITGSLGKMDLTELNRMILPLANIEVKSGICNGLKFAVSANSVKSHVDMTFLYDDLKVELFKEKKKKGLVKRGFLSGVVNSVAVRTRNPNRNKVRTGEGSFERDPYKSQFNYLWKSLFPGIKNTVLAI